MSDNKSLNTWLKILAYEANARGYKGNIVDDYGINHWVDCFRNNMAVEESLGLYNFLF